MGDIDRPGSRRAGLRQVTADPLALSPRSCDDRVHRGGLCFSIATCRIGTGSTEALINETIPVKCIDVETTRQRRRLRGSSTTPTLGRPARSTAIRRLGVRHHPLLHWPGQQGPLLRCPCQGEGPRVRGVVNEGIDYSIPTAIASMARTGRTSWTRARLSWTSSSRCRSGLDLTIRSESPPRTLASLSQKPAPLQGEPNGR